MNIIIRDATVEDAAFIGRVVADAIGEDVLREITGSDEGVAEMRRVFGRLAARTDSQYSYLNTLIAVDSESGQRLGGVVVYDGARLHELRIAFVDEVNRSLNWELTEEEMDDETNEGEFYLDSLMVEEKWRGRGVASSLIKAVCEKYARSGKPVGLLVDYTNERAARLYRSLGFRPYGEVRFCGVAMEHMQCVPEASTR